MPEVAIFSHLELMCVYIHVCVCVCQAFPCTELAIRKIWLRYYRESKYTAGEHELCCCRARTLFGAHQAIDTLCLEECNQV